MIKALFIGGVSDGQVKTVEDVPKIELNNQVYLQCKMFVDGAYYFFYIIPGDPPSIYQTVIEQLMSGYMHRAVQRDEIHRMGAKIMHLNDLLLELYEKLKEQTPRTPSSTDLQTLP